MGLTLTFADADADSLYMVVFFYDQPVVVFADVQSSVAGRWQGGSAGRGGR